MWECGSKGYGFPAKYCCESAGEKTRCCSTSAVVFELAAAATGNPSSMAPAWLLQSGSSSTKPTSSTPVVSDSLGATDPTLSSTLHQVPATSQAAPVTQSNSLRDQKIGAGVGIPLGIVIMICLALSAYLIRYKRHSEVRLKQLGKQPMARQQGMLEENSSRRAGGPYEMFVHERPAMLGVPKDHLHELPPVPKDHLHELPAIERG